MATTRQKLILLAITTLVSGALVGVGVLVGFRMKDRAFERLFRDTWKGETLGRLVEGEARQALSQVYEDPLEALQGLDEYAWAPRNVPTPFVGSAPEPGRHHNALINSLQFRADSELRMPKPAAEWRVFLTGGSTAFSSGAPHQNRTIGSHLERLLNQTSSVADRRYRVYTMANPSWASTHERIVIENLLSQLQADLVISLSGINDVHWAIRGRNVLWFRTYSDQHFWDIVDTAYRAFGQRGLADVEDLRHQPVDPEMVAQRLEMNVRLASTALSMGGTRYLFALQPSLYLTGKDLSPRESERLEKENQAYFRDCVGGIRARLERLQTASLGLVDLTGVFDGMDASQEVFLDSYHFGDRGNRIIAQRLAAAVRNLPPAQRRSEGSVPPSRRQVDPGAGGETPGG